jgi:hypothetical protein
VNGKYQHNVGAAKNAAAVKIITKKPIIVPQIGL